MCENVKFHFGDDTIRVDLGPDIEDICNQDLQISLENESSSMTDVN